MVVGMTLGMLGLVEVGMMVGTIDGGVEGLIDGNAIEGRRVGATDGSVEGTELGIIED